MVQFSNVNDLQFCIELTRKRTLEDKELRNSREAKP